jgi:hypothetical protein
MFDFDHCCSLYTRCAPVIYFMNTANQEKNKAMPKPQHREISTTMARGWTP